MKNLLAALTLSLFSGLSLAGGAGPAHAVEVTVGAPTVTVHPGETLRLHMEEAFLEGGQRWTAITRLPGFRLLSRDDEPQGDHGYFSTISNITYTYQVTAPALGRHVLLFSLINPDRPQDAVLWPLLVKVVP